jgi:hypothetical protein
MESARRRDADGETGKEGFVTTDVLELAAKALPQ